MKIAFINPATGEEVEVIEVTSENAKNIGQKINEYTGKGYIYQYQEEEE